jgi:hypothetical protein
MMSNVVVLMLHAGQPTSFMRPKFRVRDLVHREKVLQEIWSWFLKDVANT